MGGGGGGSGGGSGGVGLGGQGGCERRTEIFVKIQKKKLWGGGVRVDVIKELKSFGENSKKKKIQGGEGVGLGGVRGWT